MFISLTAQDNDVHHVNIHQIAEVVEQRTNTLVVMALQATNSDGKMGARFIRIEDADSKARLLAALKEVK
jgi:hypothetical protein